MRKKMSEENTEGREAVYRTRETVISIEEDMKEFYTHVRAMDIPGNSDRDSQQSCPRERDREKGEGKKKKAE